MKNLLVASLAGFALASGSALAADMPLKASLLAPAPAYSWTGCYVDAGGGYGLWTQDHTITGPILGVSTTTASTTDGGRGWLGRVGVGCDYQVAPKWVIGALGDYDFMSLNGTNSPSELLTLGGLTSPISANEKETGAWYAGGRIGYLIAPSVLTYFDGGYTRTHFTNSAEFLTANGTSTAFGYPSYNTGGWFLGGGTDNAISDFLPGLPPGLFLRSEYRYSTYQRSSITETTLATGVPTGNVENTKPSVQTVTTSLIYRFNWTGH